MGMSVIQSGELENRRTAGRALAQKLLKKHYDNPVVLALPRGGVPVAAEIANALGAPLDVILVRKIGVPGHEEVALGAVVDGNPPELIVNDDLRRRCGISEVELHEMEALELTEIDRRRKEYTNQLKPLSLTGRTVIIVDDGIATGSTMRAALAGIRRKKPAKLVLAIGVAPIDILDQLFNEVSDIVCLVAPEILHSVGMHYRDFSQVSDDEVVDLLAQVNSRSIEAPTQC